MPKNDDVEPAEVGQIEDLALDFDPDPHFARGDCRDAMLNILRSTADFSRLDENRQRDINAAIDNAASTIVTKLVSALAAEGRETVRCKVEQLTIKDGIKLTATTLFDHDTLVLLGELQGKHVLLVAADTGAHDNQRGPAHVDIDQPELPVGDDDLVDAADPPAHREPDVQRDVEIQDAGGA